MRAAVKDMATHSLCLILNFLGPAGSTFSPPSADSETW